MKFYLILSFALFLSEIEGNKIYFGGIFNFLNIKRNLKEIRELKLNFETTHIAFIAYADL